MCCCCLLLLFVVVVRCCINYFFFSYSNFSYKMGGLKASIKWVFLGYFVVRLPCEKV